MKPDYKNEFLTAVPPAKVYGAITGKIAEWWSADFHGHSSEPGDEFTVRFGNTFKTMRVLSTIANEYVQWECIDQHIEMPEPMAALTNPREWVGNRISWNISNNGDTTLLRFCHEGLNSSSECWSVCEPGWDQTLYSLRELLRTGKGRPFVQLDQEHLERANELYGGRS
jgi:hypothetical protein